MLSWYNCASQHNKSNSGAHSMILQTHYHMRVFQLSSHIITTTFRLLGLFCLRLIFFTFFPLPFLSFFTHILSVGHYIISPGSKGWLHPHHPVITLLTYSQYNFMPHAEKEIMAQPTINGEKAHSQFLDVSRLLYYSTNPFNIVS